MDPLSELRKRIAGSDRHQDRASKKMLLALLEIVAAQDRRIFQLEIELESGRSDDD